MLHFLCDQSSSALLMFLIWQQRGADKAGLQYRLSLLPGLLQSLACLQVPTLGLSNSQLKLEQVVGVPQEGHNGLETFRDT